MNRQGSVNRILFLCLILLSVCVHAVDKQILKEHNVNINDTNRTLTLPPDSTVEIGASPVIRIPGSDGKLLHLSGQRIGEQYALNVEGVFYSIDNPPLVPPANEPVLYNAVPTSQYQAAIAEKEKLQKELEELKKKIESQQKDLKAKQEELSKSNDARKLLEREKEAVKSDLRKQTGANKKLGSELDKEKSAAQQLHKTFSQKEQGWIEQLERIAEEKRTAEEALKQLKDDASKESAELQQKIKSLEAEQETIRQEAEKARKDLKAQNKTLMQRKDEEHKAEVAKLGNANKQLKAELARAKGKVVKVDSGTQTVSELESLDKEESPADSEATLDAVSNASLEDSTETEPKKKKKKKTGRKGKKSKAAEPATVESEKPKEEKKPLAVAETDEKTEGLPASHRGLMDQIQKLMDEQLRKDRLEKLRKDKAGKIHLRTFYNPEHIRKTLAAVLSLPKDEKSYGQTVAKKLVNLLEDNFDRRQERGEARHMESAMIQIVQLIAVYPQLHQELPLTTFLVLAFSEEEVPPTIEKDAQALAVIAALQEEWRGFRSVLLPMLPTSLDSGDKLLLALQGLLYGLIVEDLALVDQMQTLLADTIAVNNLIETTVYKFNDEDETESGDAELARQLFSSVVYIKRILAYLVRRYQNGESLIGENQAHISEIAMKVGGLIAVFQAHQADFESGDMEYAEDGDGEVINDVELTDDCPEWKAILAALGGKPVQTQAVVPQQTPIDYRAMAVAGFVQQVQCLIDQQPLAETPGWIPLDRFKHLTLTIKRHKSIKPCLFDIARSLWPKSQTPSILNFVILLLNQIVTESSHYGVAFIGMQDAIRNIPGNKPKQNKVLKEVVKAAESTASLNGDFPAWGGMTIYQFIAKFINRPVLLIFAGGSVGEQKTIALYFEPGLMEVHYSDLSELPSVISNHPNMLVVGFAWPESTASAASNTFGGVWLHLESDSQPATVEVVGTVETVPCCPPADHSGSPNNSHIVEGSGISLGLPLPGHLLPGAIGVAIEQLSR